VRSEIAVHNIHTTRTQRLDLDFSIVAAHPRATVPLVYPCGQTERSQLFAYFRENAESVPPVPGLSSGSYMTVIQDASLALRSRKQAYFEHP